MAGVTLNGDSTFSKSPTLPASLLTDVAMPKTLSWNDSVILDRSTFTLAPSPKSITRAQAKVCVVGMSYSYGAENEVKQKAT